MEARVHEYLRQYVEYIRNTGRDPLLIAWFDDDWEPVGPDVRRQLREAGLIVEDGDGLWLAETGVGSQRAG